MSNIIQPTLINDSMFRPSGGSDNITSGIAKIQSIKGKSVSWNQLVPNANKNITNEVADTKDFFTLVLQTYNGSTYGNIIWMEFTSPTTYSEIVKCPADVTTLNYKHNGSLVDEIIWSMNNVIGGHTYYVKSDILAANPSVVGELIVNNNIFIDLTRIYGEGNEPTTVEQFEADYYKWFGKPLTYEEYNEGSLRSVQMSAIKTTGFNQWDEEWEVGSFNTTTGLNEGSNGIRTKNFVSVIGNTTYYAHIGNRHDVWAMFFDSNKNVIENVVTGSAQYENVCKIDETSFKTPINCAYIKFYVLSGYGNSYLNDICINISNSSKNGTYEPYEEHISNIPITSLKGKLNGSGESVTIFPDGMKSAGSVHDEIYVSNGKTYAIDNLVDVLMTDLSWNKLYGNKWQTDASSYKKINGIVICGKFPSGSYGDWSFIPNLTISYSGDNIVLRIDGDISNEEFMALIAGVHLYVERITPLVYEVEDFTLPIYQVDEDGTEEQVQKPNTQGIAAIIGSKYCGIIKQFYDAENQLWYDYGSGLTYSENTKLWYFNGEPIYQVQTNLLSGEPGLLSPDNLKKIESENSISVVNSTRFISASKGTCIVQFADGSTTDGFIVNKLTTSPNVPKIDIIIDNTANHSDCVIDISATSSVANISLDMLSSITIPQGQRRLLKVICTEDKDYIKLID